MQGVQARMLIALIGIQNPASASGGGHKAANCILCVLTEKQQSGVAAFIKLNFKL